MASNYKIPPPLTDESSYERWKKEMSLWQTVTKLTRSEMAPAIVLGLTGQARDAALDVAIL